MASGRIVAREASGPLVQVHLVEPLPRNANGKVDASKLTQAGKVVK